MKVNENDDENVLRQKLIQIFLLIRYSN